MIERYRRGRCRTRRHYHNAFCAQKDYSVRWTPLIPDCPALPGSHALRRIRRAQGRRGGRSPASSPPACLLAGCSEIEFYWQGIAGQTDLLARAKPIPEVIATTPDAALKARLVRAQEIRAFASRELALPDNRTLHELRGPRAAVRAVERVRGARAFADAAASGASRSPDASRIAAISPRPTRAPKPRASRPTGDDVHLSGIPAYSTLGYFDDPVLSTFVRYREVELARLIFHELAHQVVYVKDDTSFNESFAVAVEEAGIARWLAAEARGAGPGGRGASSPPMPSAGASFAPPFARSIACDARAPRGALRERRRRDDEKRAGKAAAFAAHARGIRSAQGGVGGRPRVRALVRRRREQCRHRRRRRCTPTGCRSSRRCSRRRTATSRGSTRASRRWRRCPRPSASPRCSRRRARRVAAGLRAIRLFCRAKRVILSDSLASPRADRGRPPGGARYAAPAPP